jgi:hypothetical protein
MSFDPPKVGSALAEPEEPRPPIPEGENLCASCAAAPLCHVRIAIFQTAPEGGIEIGACGFYVPTEQGTSEPTTG